MDASHTTTDARMEAGLPALLTLQEAAKLCSVGQRTLWRWSRSGIAPRPVKLGRGTRAATRYRRDEILRWIDAGCPRIDGGGAL
jgi:predicted DNA-binding transcriptional regulator AlpA